MGDGRRNLDGRSENELHQHWALVVLKHGVGAVCGHKKKWKGLLTLRILDVGRGMRIAAGSSRGYLEIVSVRL